ncbi:unnamed protein product [Adineta ricciae]|uniref:C-type lectin domain-containing protein n=1 Tax=Adineta ricciae TaxID=249248 RepID=A0A814F9I3_ADIRI|nr:unnamed protein product [Adineta ricciae]
MSTKSLISNKKNDEARVKSIMINKLIDDPQMKEMIVMEYEQLTPSQIWNRFKQLAKKQGNCLIPNWLSLVLCNLFLVFLFGLMAAAIMLAKDPPGQQKQITAAPLKANLSYNESCYTFDSSCSLTLNLWCINDYCQCYNQLYYWNGVRCVKCPSTFYYNGSQCTCPSNLYLQGPTNTLCASYKTYTQSCTTYVLCDSSVGLYCDNGKCNCTYDYYWSSTDGSCVRYSSNTENCSSTIYCLPSDSTGNPTSLTCLNGTCQCPTSGKWYWTGDVCTQIKSYNGSCFFDQQCDGTLQLICNNGVCVCSGATAYGTWFWNGTQCVLCPLGWLNYEIYCYYNSPIPATQPVAREYCQQYGGDLLYIESQTEFKFIEPRAAAIIGSYNLAFVGYITLNNTAPGSFTWYNGKTFTGAHTPDVWWCEANSPYGYQPTYSYRSSATPQVQACGALQVYGGTNVCMNDWWCSASLPFICKKSQ